MRRIKNGIFDYDDNFVTDVGLCLGNHLTNHQEITTSDGTDSESNSYSISTFFSMQFYSHKTI